MDLWKDVRSADRAHPSSRNYDGNWVRQRWDSAVAVGAGAYLEIEGNLPSVNADRAISVWGLEMVENNESRWAALIDLLFRDKCALPSVNLN